MTKIILPKNIKRAHLVSFVLIFAGIGAAILISTHASTPTTAVEAESNPGSIVGPAAVVNDNSASGGKAVAFGPPVQSGYTPPTPGTYQPTAATTGYSPYGNQLTAYTNQFGAISGGLLTISQSNVTISGYNIPARIKITGANVTITKSFIHGDATALGADDGLVVCASPITANSTDNDGCTIEDSVLAPDHPSYYWNGIRGSHFLAQRNNIYDVVDGMDVYAPSPNTDTHVTIIANYIHDLAGFAPDTPNNRPFTHNDDIQWVGGLNPTISDNNFLGFLDPNVGQANQDPAHSINITPEMYNSNSILQVNQASAYGVSRGLVFDHNWVDGGSASLNFYAGSLPAGNVGSVTNNIFSRRQYYQGAASSGWGNYGSGGDSGITFTSVGGFTFTAPNAALPSGSGTTTVSDPNGNNTYADNGHKITVRLAN